MLKNDFICNDCGKDFEAKNNHSVNCPMCESINVKMVIQPSKNNGFGSAFGGCGCSSGKCSDPDSSCDNCGK